MLIIVVLSGCNTYSNNYAAFMTDKNDNLIIKGYMVSGSPVIYWKYNLQSQSFKELKTPELISILELKSHFVNENNIDEKKVKHHYKLIHRNLDRFYSGYFNPDMFNLIVEPKLRSIINIEEDQLISKNVRYKITTDRSNSTFIIKNTKTGNTKKVAFNNYVWGQTPGPDSNYMAYFEHQPFAFNDGSSYVIRVLDLEKGSIYSLNNSLVSLPGAMIWVNSEL